MSDDILIRRRHGSTLVLQFNHSHHHNPMSALLERNIVAACKVADSDPEVSAVVLTGGPGRSFCVGGDFNEVSRMRTEPEVDAWIDRVIALYVSVLSVTKPVVAAVDGHAIGIGFQLALTCDWRVGTDKCQFRMPELAKGIACTLGSYMLEKMLDRARMLRILVECKTILAPEALRAEILNDVVPPEKLTEAAIQRAELLGAYPSVPMRTTKAFMNADFIQGLKGIADACKAAHRRSFAERSGDLHFRSVLGAKAEAGHAEDGEGRSSLTA